MKNHTKKTASCERKSMDNIFAAFFSVIRVISSSFHKLDEFDNRPVIGGGQSPRNPMITIAGTRCDGELPWIIGSLKSKNNPMNIFLFGGGGWGLGVLWGRGERMSELNRASCTFAPPPKPHGLEELLKQMEFPFKHTHTHKQTLTHTFLSLFREGVFRYHTRLDPLRIKKQPCIMLP